MFLAPLTTAWMHDSMDGGGRATPGAVADDCMDAGGRATPGAVAEALTE
ncbi:MAG TPA: hypothetical protein VJ396_00635 [Acidiferrobacterales bacterium]|nr:hypothetical protein [Acidiferrobacterales bacterium]